jgi:hypothetical protein
MKRTFAWTTLLVICVAMLWAGDLAKQERMRRVQPTFDAVGKRIGNEPKKQVPPAVPANKEQ